MGQMNRWAYEDLVKGDLEWLRRMPDCLEKQHIAQVLADSPERFFGQGRVSGYSYFAALDAIRLALMFHAGGPWDDRRRQAWYAITESDEATTAVLCQTLRKLEQDIQRDTAERRLR